MSTVRKLLILLVILHTVSCVSMKKFSSVNALLTDIRKDSAAMSEQIKENSKRLDDLLRRNIALGTDTLRLFSEYKALMEKHERICEENHQELVRLNAQIHGTSRRASSSLSGGRVSKAATSLSKSISNLGNEVQSILSNESKSLYRIEPRNWELTILLRDSLLYVPVMDNDKIVYDHNRLSTKGEALLYKLASMFVEKDNFDIVVRENIFINSPYLRYIPNAKTEEITTVDKQVVTAVIDTLMHRGVVSYVANRPAEVTTTTDNAVIDARQSQRLDSIRAVQEAERIKQQELNRRTEMIRQGERAKRMAADRTTVVMRALMRQCYMNLGSTRLSRDVSYMKVGLNAPLPENDWIEIIIRPDVSDLQKLLKDLENKNNNK